MREYFIWLAKMITLVFLVIIGIPLLIGAVIGASAVVSGKKTVVSISGNPNVAVIELVGPIEDSKETLKQLYESINDDTIKGVVLRVDSPGGAVAPSQDIYRAVTKLKQKKPIVTSMGSIAASGGFYAAIAGSKVMAQPGTMTGSIGVIMQLPNVQKASEKVGLDMVTIRSGNLKDAGNMFRPMTDQEKIYLEDVAGVVHKQFIDDIVAARKVSLDKLRTFADGRIILGSQAKDLGLVDQFGDIDDAALLVLELGGVKLEDHQKPNLIYYEDKFHELKKLLKAVSDLPLLIGGGFNLAPQLRYQ